MKKHYLKVLIFLLLIFCSSIFAFDNEYDSSSAFNDYYGMLYYCISNELAKQDYDTTYYFQFDSNFRMTQLDTIIPNIFSCYLEYSDNWIYKVQIYSRVDTLPDNVVTVDMMKNIFEIPNDTIVDTSAYIDPVEQWIKIMRDKIAGFYEYQIDLNKNGKTELIAWTEEADSLYFYEYNGSFDTIPDFIIGYEGKKVVLNSLENQISINRGDLNGDDCFPDLAIQLIDETTKELTVEQYWCGDNFSETPNKILSYPMNAESELNAGSLALIDINNDQISECIFYFEDLVYVDYSDKTTHDTSTTCIDISSETFTGGGTNGLFSVSITNNEKKITQISLFATIDYTQDISEVYYFHEPFDITDLEQIIEHLDRHHRYYKKW